MDNVRLSQRFQQLGRCREQLRRHPVWIQQRAGSEQAATPEPEEVLYADYTYEDYNGDSTVIYRNGDRYFWVSGGHCSCYGLEGQWDPEEHTREEIEELAWRLWEGAQEYEYDRDRTNYGAAGAILTHMGVTDIPAAFKARKNGFEVAQAADTTVMLEGARF